MRAAYWRYLGVLAVAGFAWMGSGVAVAQPSSTPVLINCTSMGQLCTPPFTAPLTTTTGYVSVSFQASPLGCTEVSIHFQIDGIELAVSPFLAPGVTSATYLLGPIAQGSHVLGLQAEGRLGGCNTGNLGSWAGIATGDANALPSAASAAAIPAPGIVATAIAFLLGAFAVFRRRRART